MRLTFTLIMISIGALTVAAQSPFVCDGSLYVTLDQQMYRMELDLENSDFSFIALPNTSGVNLNAIGYRNTDNYIYGIADHLFFYTLCRIDASGKATILDTLDIDQTLTLPAGTVTDDGRYLIVMDVWTDSLAEATNNLLFIDLESPDYDLSIFTVENMEGERNNVFSADLVFNPLQRNLIGYDVYQKRLFRLHLDSNTFDFAGFPEVDNVAGSIPALFFDPFSQLYGYERNDLFNELYFIETTDGQIQKISKDDDLRLAPYRDGCSCPYTVKMQKTVSPPMAYPCTEVIYSIKIGNLNRAPQTDLLLEDLLPEGFVVTEILHNPYPVSIQGLGTNALSLHGFDLDIGTDSIVFKVSVPEYAAGIYFNQATLSGVDLSLANDIRTTIISDFPPTEQVDDPTPLEVLVFPPDQSTTSLEFCEDTPLLLQATLIPESVQVEWDDGSRQNNRLIDEAGVYRVTVTTGCATREMVFITNETSLELSLDQEVIIGYGDSIAFAPHIESSVPIANYQWNWDGSGILSCMDCPIVQLNPEVSGNLSLEVWTENGCKAQTAVFVSLSRAVYIPNAFSPNLDGINDHFTIYSGTDISLVAFKVFDRWGGLVFEQNNVSLGPNTSGWDGTISGKTAMPGIYVWFAEIEFPDGVKKRFSGDVVLVR